VTQLLERQRSGATKASSPGLCRKLR